MCSGVRAAIKENKRAVVGTGAMANYGAGGCLVMLFLAFAMVCANGEGVGTEESASASLETALASTSMMPPRLANASAVSSSHHRRRRSAEPCMLTVER
jgi:hypothetical protein